MMFQNVQKTGPLAYNNTEKCQISKQARPEVRAFFRMRILCTINRNYNDFDTVQNNIRSFGQAGI